MCVVEVAIVAKFPSVPAGYHQPLRNGPLPLPQGKDLQPPVGRSLALLSAKAEKVVVYVGSGAEDENERGDVDGVPVGRLQVEWRRLGKCRPQMFLQIEQSRCNMSRQLRARNLLFMSQVLQT